MIFEDDSEGCFVCHARHVRAYRGLRDSLFPLQEHGRDGDSLVTDGNADAPLGQHLANRPFHRLDRPVNDLRRASPASA
jgi:hypothetical protein